MPKRSPIDREGLDALARQREAIVAVAELRRVGVPASTIAYRTRPSGPWQRPLPGVVALSNGVLTWRQRVLAALCYAGPGALLSGTAAMRLQAVTGLAADGGTVHVLVPHARRPTSRSYVQVERTRRVPEHRVVRGIACAPVARAVADAARRLREVDAVRALVAAAVQQGRCSVTELLTEIEPTGPPGLRLPRLVLDEVQAGVRSVAEARVRRDLRAAGLPEPLWNHDLYDSSGQWLGRPDGLWLDLGVALEIDSIGWHLSPESYRRTQARQRRMTGAGVLVIVVAPSDAVGPRAVSFVPEVRATLDTARRRTAPVLQAVPPLDRAA